jgi:transcriptional regulator with XRE-family HTH domain
VILTNIEQQAQRFKDVIESFQYTQVAVAEILGCSQEYISQLSRGDRKLSGRILQNIAKNLPEVNLDWLIRGVGPMRVVQTYQNEDEDLSEPNPDYPVDPLAGLRDVVRRLEELEAWKDTASRELAELMNLLK